jgi:hypothetical protein
MWHMGEIPQTPYVIGRPAGYLWWTIRRVAIFSLGYLVFCFITIAGFHHIAPHTPLRNAIWLLVPYAVVLLWREWRTDLGPYVASRIKGARGEETVGRVLATLPPAFRVLNDVLVSRGNVDHVVVGPTGVFAIETKAWVSRLWLAKGGVLQKDGEDASEVTQQAIAGAMQIRDRLAPIGINKFVRAVVALSSSKLSRGPMHLRRVDVIEAADLRAYIMERRFDLTAPDVERASAALAPLVNGRRQKRRATSV